MAGRGAEVKKRLVQKSSIIGDHAIHYCAYDQFDFGKIDFRYQTLLMTWVRLKNW